MFNSYRLAFPARRARPRPPSPFRRLGSLLRGSPPRSPLNARAAAPGPFMRAVARGGAARRLPTAVRARPIIPSAVPMAGPADGPSTAGARALCFVKQK